MTRAAAPRVGAWSASVTADRAPLNQSLARGLQILQVFESGQTEFGIRDLARRVKIDRSITYRLVRTLTDAGFLEQNKVNQQYRIGYRAFEIGQHYTRSGALYDIAVAALTQLSAAESLNLYLAKRVEHALLYLAAVENDTSVVRAAAGTRGHLHATALGKVLLAAEPPGVLKELMPRLSMARLTPETTTSRTRLMRELRQVRMQGYAISAGEFLYGVVAVGAPVFDASGQVVAAISASGSNRNFTGRRLQRVTELVVHCAADISARIG